MKSKAIITWLYPDLMDTYGDRGNIISLSKRLVWRGIDFEVHEISLGEKIPPQTNFIFLGGAQDRQQQLVMKDLLGRSEFLQEYIENEGVGLFVCAGYQLMGNFYQDADGTKIEGLGIMDLETIHPGASHPRLIGNVVVECSFLEGEKTVVGFENHGGRTLLGKKLEALGRVLKGHGNNGQDGFEGARYKNALGSYLHGPILPKNPELADYLLGLALGRQLEKLPDVFEKRAHEDAIRKSKTRRKGWRM